jgi:O-antigen biosynthesis protein
MKQFNPLQFPSCLKFPLRLAPSSWIQHVPFAMFLIGAIRPKVFVELGSYYGTSYCAFCQTVSELQLETKCYAVDTWQGDAQGGNYGSEVLSDLRAHHDPLYRGFSHLLQSTFDSAVGQFADGTIDLLHIDGFHTYEAVKRDFVTWLPKMSQAGVVLFHDVNVREGDFGVWQLWDELKTQYPHYDVPFGYGLGLLAVGPQPPEAIRQLVTLPAEELKQVREFFYQLGLRVETARTLKLTEEELAHVKEQYKVLEREHNKLKRLRGIRLLQALSSQGVRRALLSRIGKSPANLNAKNGRQGIEPAG